jgi:hypothetical protein
MVFLLEIMLAMPRPVRLPQPVKPTLVLRSVRPALESQIIVWPTVKGKVKKAL